MVLSSNSFTRPFLPTSRCRLALRHINLVRSEPRKLARYMSRSPSLGAEDADAGGRRGRRPSYFVTTWPYFPGRRRGPGPTATEG